MEVLNISGSRSAACIIEGSLSAASTIEGSQSWLYIPAEVGKAVVDVSKVGR